MWLTCNAFFTLYKIHMHRIHRSNAIIAISKKETFRQVFVLLVLRTFIHKPKRISSFYFKRFLFSTFSSNCLTTEQSKSCDSWKRLVKNAVCLLLFVKELCKNGKKDEILNKKQLCNYYKSDIKMSINGHPQKPPKLGEKPTTEFEFAYLNDGLYATFSYWCVGRALRCR